MRIYDGTKLACEVVEPFSIRPEGGFTNKIYSEKPIYDPETVAVFHDRVVNSYKNYYPGRITDTVTVRDKVGNTLFTQVFDMGNMFDHSRDALGNTTLNTYDANGNLKTKTDALRNVTQYVYSPDGRLLSMINALGIKIENEYNQKSELITVNAFGVQQASFSYNSFGQTTQMSDALGNATNYEYQYDGRLKSISDNIGLVMQFTYDSKGNVVSATNGANDCQRLSFSCILGHCFEPPKFVHGGRR